MGTTVSIMQREVHRLREVEGTQRSHSWSMVEPRFDSGGLSTVLCCLMEQQGISRKSTELGVRKPGFLT